MLSLKNGLLLPVLLSVVGTSCAPEDLSDADDAGPQALDVEPQALSDVGDIRACVTLTDYTHPWQPPVCTADLNTSPGAYVDMMYQASDIAEAKFGADKWGIWLAKMVIKMPTNPSNAALDALKTLVPKVMAGIRKFYDWNGTDEERMVTVSSIVQDTFDEVERQQKAQLATLPAQTEAAVDAATDALWTKMDSVYAHETDPQRVTAAERLRRTLDLTDFVSNATTRVSALQTSVTSLANSFKSLRTSEATIFSGASSLATRAAAATPATLPDVQVDLDSWYNRTTATIDALAVNASDVADSADELLTSTAQGLENNADFLSANGLTRPSVDRELGRQVGNVVGYADLLRRWVDAAYLDIVDGIALKQQAFIDIAADQATRDTFANTAFSKAAAGFLDEASARISAVSTTFPTTVRLRVPLLADRMVLLSTFLEMEPLCAPASLTDNSWRQAGCIALNKQFTRARTTLSTSIPTLAKLVVSSLRRDGFDETQLRSIEADLAAGTTSSVRSAVLAVDAAVLMVDTLPSALPPPPAAPPATALVAPATLSAGAPKAQNRVDIAGTVQALDGFDGFDDPTRLDAPGEVWWHYWDRVDNLLPRMADALRKRNDAVTTAQQNLTAANALKTQVLAAAASSTVDQAALLASLDKIPNLPAAMRQRVVDTFADIRRTLADLQARVRTAGLTYNDSAKKLATALTGLATVAGLSDTAVTAFIPAYPSTRLPRITIPELTLTAPSSDGFATIVSTYVDNVLATLNATITNNQVTDRAMFAGTVRAYRDNQQMLADTLAGRVSVSSAELVSFAAQDQRVTDLVSRYMDPTGWFLDVPVSAATRTLVDGPITSNFLRVAGSLKDSINRWSYTAAEAKLQETMLTALGRVATAAVPGVLDQQTMDLTERLLSDVFERNVTSGRISRGDLVQFCQAVTGKIGCDPTKGTLTFGDQVTAALSLAISDLGFWRAVAEGSSGSVANTVASLFTTTSDLSTADRMALAARLRGPALVHLLGATGAQLNTIASQLGDSTVRQLGASLSLAKLQDLNVLRGVLLVDEAARKAAASRGAAVKKIGPLAGKTTAALRTALAAASFVKKSATSTEEIWAHTDGSVVRLFPAGSTDLPTKRHLMKQISKGTGLTPSDMLCALTDAGAIEPNSASEAAKALSTWYRKPESAGHSPSSAELTELSAVWLTRTHIEYTP